MQHLRQSTASQEISLGPFLDTIDGDTEEDGLTIANTDIKIRKHGGTTLINKNSGGATVISQGIYQTTLDATDTDTAGQLEIYVHVTGALYVKSTYMVLTATAFDALYTGTFNNFDSATDTVANVTTVATTTTNSDMRGTDSAATAANLATVDTNVDAILIDTAEIGVAGAGLTNINLPNQTMDITGNLSGSVGSVTTVNDKTGYSISGSITTLDGLNNFNPTTEAVANVTLVATTTTNTDMRGTDGANTTTPPTTSAITDSVWDEPQSGHVTAGTFGLYLDSEVSTAGGGGLTQQNVRDAMKLTPTAGSPSSGSVDEHLDTIENDTSTDLPVQISSLNNISASDVWTFGTRTLTAFSFTVDSNLIQIRSEVLTGDGDASPFDVA